MRKNTCIVRSVLLFGLFGIFTTRVAAQPTGPEQNLNARVSALEEKVAVAEQLLVNQVQQISSLQQRVVSLESAVFRPSTVTVDCASGETVVAALAQAPAAGPVIITVVGRCAEAVTIDRNNTILRGTSTGDGLDAPSPADDVLNVTSGAHVTLDHITLFNGRLLVQEGAHVTAFGSLLHSILVSGGNLHLTSQTVVEAFRPVHAESGSLVSVDLLSEIRGSPGPGLVLTGGSIGGFGRGGRVANSQTGVLVSGGSVLQMGAFTVENNSGDGILVRDGSAVVFAARGKAEVSIRRNQGNGLSLRDTSVATLIPQLQILDNGGWGILCSPPPAGPRLPARLAVSRETRWEG